MRILVINNYYNAEKISELSDAVGKFSLCGVVPYHEIGANYRVGPDIEGIVLSGSEARIVKTEDMTKFSGVSQLIRNIDLPLLGICYGHQLMCVTLGAEVGVLEKPAMNIFESVHLIREDRLFNGFSREQSIPLAETHNDYVKKESLPQANLILLADSLSCEVEAVKHVGKPFYGIQFHPEKTHIKEEQHKEGLKVIRNFCSLS